tara:strand:+ start:292 stop:903 length:612 start_codon:yes stop_codon:yes gene_type:complete
MYLSSLQKHILSLARKNMINENLSLNSESFENSIITYSNVKKANSIIQKMENGSIENYISLKTKLDKLKLKYPFTQLSNIEPNSNGSAHICFYEPLISFFNLKLKRNRYLNQFSKNSIYKNDSRKFIEICKRKFIRSDGNHKKGIIRGECKKLKAAKASTSRTYKTLTQKKYLRKIDILDYENYKIGIGFNLTKNGNDLAKKL